MERFKEGARINQQRSTSCRFLRYCSCGGTVFKRLWRTLSTRRFWIFPISAGNAGISLKDRSSVCGGQVVVSTNHKQRQRPPPLHNKSSQNPRDKLCLNRNRKTRPQHAASPSTQNNGSPGWLPGGLPLLVHKKREARTTTEPVHTCDDLTPRTPWEVKQAKQERSQNGEHAPCRLAAARRPQAAP
jgi:hypothetical protein